MACPPALILALLLAPLASASERTLQSAAELKWHARGTPAARTDPGAVARSPAAQPAKRPVRRAVFQWTASRMSYQPPRARPRNSILHVGGYEEVEVPQVGASKSSDADAHKNPFYVASQLADSQDSPEAAGELPMPEKSATDVEAVSELPIPDTAATAAQPASELPIPDETVPDAETTDEPPIPDTAESPGEPAPLTPSDELFEDDPIPTLPDTEFQLPPGDLSEGISTVAGGPGCKGYDEQCRDALRELQDRDITSVVVGVIIEGTEGTDFPCDCLLGRDFEAPRFTPRDFSPTLFTWKASGNCHKPLYFEDVQLERYGHAWNPVLQPFISGAHFFVSVPLLPYKMGLKPPNECVYTLGYYRPGSCAPYMFEPIPLSVRAALWQGVGSAAFAFWFWPPN